MLRNLVFWSLIVCTGYVLLDGLYGLTLGPFLGGLGEIWVRVKMLLIRAS